MKILKSRTFIGGVCILLAAMIAFIAIPAAIGSRSATVTVYTAAMDIARGTVLTDDSVIAQKLIQSASRDSYITDKAQIVGKAVKNYIYYGDYITAEKLTDKVVIDPLDTAIENGLRFVSITINSLAAGVSGHLAAGDFVSVVCYEDKEKSVNNENGVAITESIKTAYIPEGLERVQILSIQNDKNQIVVPASELSAESKPEDNIAKTVTMIVNEQQMLRLVEAENKGTMHLAFVAREG